MQTSCRRSLLVFQFQYYSVFSYSTELYLKHQIKQNDVLFILKWPERMKQCPLLLPASCGFMKTNTESETQTHLKMQMDRQTDRWNEGSTGRFSLAPGGSRGQTRPLPYSVSPLGPLLGKGAGGPKHWLVPCPLWSPQPTHTHKAQVYTQPPCTQWRPSLQDRSRWLFQGPDRWWELSGHVNDSPLPRARCQLALC